MARSIESALLGRPVPKPALAQVTEISQRISFDIYAARLGDLGSFFDLAPYVKTKFVRRAADHFEIQVLDATLQFGDFQLTRDSASNRATSVPVAIGRRHLICLRSLSGSFLNAWTVELD